MENAVQNLLDWFAQADTDDALARIEGLAASDVPEEVALAVLIALLRHDDARLRLAAVAALGDFGAKADVAVPALEELLNKPSSLFGGIMPGVIGVVLGRWFEAKRTTEVIATLQRIGTPFALAAVERLKTEDSQDASPPDKKAKEAAEFDLDEIEYPLPELLRDHEESEPDRRREREEAPAESAPPPAPQAPPRPAPAAPAPAAPPSRGQHQTAPPPPALEETEPAEAQIITTQFTAYYPREVVPGQWQPLQAYIFQASAADAVAEDAEKQLETLTDYRAVGDSARQPIPEGAFVTATPYLTGFQFNPPSITIGFYEDWHSFSFKMRAVEAQIFQAVNGFLTFTVDGLIVADIPLSVFVADKPSIAPPAATDPRPVYDAIFASYSRQDMAVVERIERAMQTLGLTYLRDMITLRSGEDWNAGLLKMIEQANIFQLFWSAHAAQSPYVRQEWEYALKLNRQQASFIRPVYWSQPMPPPPPELGHIHFTYQPDLVK